VAPAQEGGSRRAGRRARGASVAALVEALALGGAPRVLVTLSGEPPPELFQRFYALRRSLPPARALREAKLWLAGREETRDPRLWAGVVLYGLPD
ncbi:MAG: CHAT domain-containing protein, partial [Planctomycetota bacterium]